MSGKDLRPWFVAFVMALAAGTLHAGDLVSNGTFGSGISGWHLVGRGSLTHSTDGDLAPGALQIDGGLAGGATHAVAGQCLRVEFPGRLLNIAASVRVVAGSPAYCRVALFESESADCSWITPGTEIRRTVFSGGWDPLTGGALTLGAATASVELRLHCATDEGQVSTLTVRFDDVTVTPGTIADQIFADGFEAGDTDAWSSTVP